MQRSVVRMVWCAFIALSWNNSADAALTGYLGGDAAPGKLVPYYEVSDNQATIIGIENVTSGANGVTDGANYANVHATLFDATSQEVFDFSLCLSPYDFGFIVLQQNPASGAQLDGLAVHGQKITAVSVAADHIPDIGYTSLSARQSADSNCSPLVGHSTTLINLAVNLDARTPIPESAPS